MPFRFMKGAGSERGGRGRWGLAVGVAVVSGMGCGSTPPAPAAPAPEHPPMSHSFAHAEQWAAVIEITGAKVD